MENQVEDKNILKAQRRVEVGTERPIEYCYVVGQNRLGLIDYVEVRQLLNDKFNGNLSQSQFFAVAEQTRRIFALNKMMIERVAEDALVCPKVRFMVQVSSKWFTSPVKAELLSTLLDDLPENTILCLDAVTLARDGEDAKIQLIKFAKERKLKILLDNVEALNFIQFVGYHADYIRLDARFIDNKDEKFDHAFKFLRDYTKALDMKLVVKNVKNELLKNYYLKANADVLEGAGIYPPKKQLASILTDYKLQNL